MVIWASHSRASFLDALALSPDRWYTIFTYWTVHAAPRHAWGNIVLWALTAGLVERKLRTQSFVLYCIIATLAVAAVILLIRTDALREDGPGNGLSIIGWMVLVPAVTMGMSLLTGSARRLKAGVFLTFLAMALGAGMMAEDPRGLPVGMLGHIGGAVVGFVAVANALRAGSYVAVPRSEGREAAGYCILAVLSVVAIWGATSLVLSQR